MSSPDEPREQSSCPAPLTPGDAVRAAVTPLLLSLSASIVCYVTLGATTGLFFGAAAVVALLTPPLVLAYCDDTRRAIAASSVVDGAGVVLLFAASDPYVTLLDWVRAYLLLAAFAVALWGVAALLTRLRVAPLFASALTVALALAWLAWPVWLSPWLAGRETLVAWLVAAHPLFGLDGTLRHLGPPWTERHLMYTRLTVLNQDVFYSLPAGVGRAVVFHALLGIACLLPCRRMRLKRAEDTAGKPAG